MASGLSAALGQWVAPKVTGEERVLGIPSPSSWPRGCHWGLGVAARRPFSSARQAAPHFFCSFLPGCSIIRSSHLPHCSRWRGFCPLPDPTGTAHCLPLPLPTLLLGGLVPTGVPNCLCPQSCPPIPPSGCQVTSPLLKDSGHKDNYFCAFKGCSPAHVSTVTLCPHRWLRASRSCPLGSAVRGLGPGRSCCAKGGSRKGHRAHSPQGGRQQPHPHCEQKRPDNVHAGHGRHPQPTTLKSTAAGGQGGDTPLPRIIWGASAGGGRTLVAGDSGFGRPWAP